MPDGKEGYQPSEEEMRAAEKRMAPAERAMSKLREGEPLSREEIEARYEHDDLAQISETQRKLQETQSKALQEREESLTPEQTAEINEIKSGIDLNDGEQKYAEWLRTNLWEYEAVCVEKAVVAAITMLRKMYGEDFTDPKWSGATLPIKEVDSKFVMYRLQGVYNGEHWGADEWPLNVEAVKR